MRALIYDSNTISAVLGLVGEKVAGCRAAVGVYILLDCHNDWEGLLAQQSNRWTQIFVGPTFNDAVLKSRRQHVFFFFFLNHLYPAVGT